jgi:hypothetical protein
MKELAGLPFGWGAIFALANLVLGGGVVATWQKNRPKMREIERTAEQKLRDDLMARVIRVEDQLEKERSGRADDRRQLEQKIDRQRELYETKLDAERARHEAAEMLSRHKVRNLEACLSAFLWMAEKRSDNIPEVVADIRRMRAEQEAAEAAERGSVAGAKIIAAGVVPDITHD